MPRRPSRPLLALLAGAALLGCVLYGSAHAEDYKIKAALLYKLTKYIQWPEDSFAAPDEPMGICVLGRNPFGDSLDALRGLRTGNRRIQVQQASLANELPAICRLVFISASKKPYLNSIVSVLKERPILSISEIDGFARRGGILELRIHEGRTRFIINLRAGRQAGLVIAAPLLSLSRVIGKKDLDHEQ